MNTNKLIDNAASDYAKFLDAGASYGASMQALAKALGGTPCPTAMERLAAVHAAKYKCNYTWNTSGDAVFYDGEKSTRESRNDAARKSWGRNVMKWFNTNKPASTKSHGRLTREARQMGMDFLANFEGKDRAAQVRAAVALLNALK
jgi:hypothetical protein